MEDRELFQAGRYREIVKKYGRNLEELEQEELNILCKSYYKMKEYQNTLKTFDVYVKKGYPKEELLLYYTWCMYQVYMNIEHPVRVTVIKALKLIIGHCKQEDTYYPYTCAVFKVLSLAKEDKITLTNEEQYKIIMLLDPKKLSSIQTVRQEEDRQIKFPSDYEKWYTYATKITYDMKNYEETIQLCSDITGKRKKTRNTNLTFHLAMYIRSASKINTKWYEYRMAQSYEKLGDTEEAIAIYEELKLKNEDFCFSSALGKLYETQGQLVLANRYYYEALTSRAGSLKNKVGVIEKVADLLAADGENEKAKLNYMLVEQIRKKELWRPSEAISTKLQRLSHVEVACEEAELEKTCKSQWNKQSLSYLEEGTGKVVRILPNKKAGFIQMEDRQLYFSVKSIRRDHDIESYLEKTVKFYIKESFDTKKNCKSYEAVRISKVK
ncbi:MAG: tetratricopeptide repeat protein [bacterium]|nr:tetratricopeptide repeat protein [bacterium]